MEFDWWDAVGCTQSAVEDGVGKEVRIIKSCYFFFLFFWFLVSLKLVPRKFERRDHPIYFISYMHSAI